MSSDPRTAAWQQVREHVKAKATAHRENGGTAVEVFADFGAVRQPPDRPVTLSFTAPDGTVADLRSRDVDGAFLETEVRYVDTDGTRLYALEIGDGETGLWLLVAGGIDHRSLSGYADTTGAARTVVRSATGAVGVELRHADRDPFFAELG